MRGSCAVVQGRGGRTANFGSLASLVGGAPPCWPRPPAPRTPPAPSSGPSLGENAFELRVHHATPCPARAVRGEGSVGTALPGDGQLMLRVPWVVAQTPAWGTRKSRRATTSRRRRRSCRRSRSARASTCRRRRALAARSPASGRASRRGRAGTVETVHAESGCWNDGRPSRPRTARRSGAPSACCPRHREPRPRGLRPGGGPAPQGEPGAARPVPAARPRHEPAPGRRSRPGRGREPVARHARARAPLLAAADTEWCRRSTRARGCAPSSGLKRLVSRTGSNQRPRDLEADRARLTCTERRECRPCAPKEDEQRG